MTVKELISRELKLFSMEEAADLVAADFRFRWIDSMKPGFKFPTGMGECVQKPKKKAKKYARHH